MGTVPAPAFAPASAGEAIEMMHAGLGYLAAADAAALGAQTQARCLRALEEAGAAVTAARARVLAAFTAGQGYCADADYSPRAWLMHKTGITRGAAAGHAAWARRAAAHPQVVAALAGREMSESYGRAICGWTGKLPADCRPAADAILVTAARAGMGLRDLAGLAAELRERSRPDLPDEDPGLGLEDRAVRLETTFGGAGVLGGDLTPACAAVVGAVLDALSAPAGAQDTRTRAQRYHDGLAEAMRRLLAAGLLPERAGQPVRALVHASLADLIQLDGSSVLMAGWTARCGRPGPRTAPPRRSAAATAAPGWTATPPAGSPATRPSPRSSPATSTWPPWMTWSGCASSSTSSAMATAPAMAVAVTAVPRRATRRRRRRQREPGRGPARALPARGRPWSRRSSARP